MHKAGRNRTHFPFPLALLVNLLIIKLPGETSFWQQNNIVYLSLNRLLEFHEIVSSNFEAIHLIMTSFAIAVIDTFLSVILFWIFENKLSAEIKKVTTFKCIIIFNKIVLIGKKNYTR